MAVRTGGGCGKDGDGGGRRGPACVTVPPFSSRHDGGACITIDVLYVIEDTGASAGG